VELYARTLPLRVLAPPIAFPALTEVVEWHYHEEDDPCLVWFRQMIVRRTALLFDVAA
jgi:LysR family nod box-dependent transcriptional activator